MFRNSHDGMFYGFYCMWKIASRLRAYEFLLVADSSFVLFEYHGSVSMWRRPWILCSTHEKSARFLHTKGAVTGDVFFKSLVRVASVVTK